MASRHVKQKFLCINITFVQKNDSYILGLLLIKYIFAKKKRRYSNFRSSKQSMNNVNPKTFQKMKEYSIPDIHFVDINENDLICTSSPQNATIRDLLDLTNENPQYENNLMDIIVEPSNLDEKIAQQLSPSNRILTKIYNNGIQYVKYINKPRNKAIVYYLSRIQDNVHVFCFNLSSMLMPLYGFMFVDVDGELKLNKEFEKNKELALFNEIFNPNNAAFKIGLIQDQIRLLAFFKFEKYNSENALKFADEMQNCVFNLANEIMQCRSIPTIYKKGAKNVTDAFSIE